eukprot:8603262-Pyramimonas_sp.AAC.1
MRLNLASGTEALCPSPGSPSGSIGGARASRRSKIIASVGSPSWPPVASAGTPAGAEIQVTLDSVG